MVSERVVALVALLGVLGCTRGVGGAGLYRGVGGGATQRKGEGILSAEMSRLKSAIARGRGSLGSAGGQDAGLGEARELA